MRRITRLYKPYVSAIEAHAQRVIVGRRDPQAYAFYARLMADGYAPNRYIDVLPSKRVIYVSVPKNASSRIKMTLSASLGRMATTERSAHNRKITGIKAPKHVGLSVFHDIATDPNALRFSFVRNPYARLFSCWIDKFRGKPLVTSYPAVDSYLAWRRAHDLSLPEGPSRTLQFDEFINFATETAGDRVDGHWNLQADLLDMPGIELNLIGKIETFQRDFAAVLDHIHATGPVRAKASGSVNFSDEIDWTKYYTSEMINRVYKAYERDFDEFRYPTSV